MLDDYAHEPTQLFIKLDLKIEISKAGAQLLSYFELDV